MDTINHINGIVALKTLLHDYMTKENFKKFDKPFLLMYYYIHKNHQMIELQGQLMEQSLKPFYFFPVQEDRKLSYKL